MRTCIVRSLKGLLLIAAGGALCWGLFVFLPWRPAQGGSGAGAEASAGQDRLKGFSEGCREKFGQLKDMAGDAYRNIANDSGPSGSPAAQTDETTGGKHGDAARPTGGEMSLPQMSQELTNIVALAREFSAKMAKVEGGGQVARTAEATAKGK